MIPKYFQGRSVTGQVAESSARSFREIVDALRVCSQLGITRAAFMAMPKSKRNEAKQVPFLVPATFKHSPSRRAYDQAVHCNLLFLDIDETADGKCPAAPLLHTPDLIHSALAGLNFAAHTTASSTPEKPRMRIIVDADAIPLNHYPQAVAEIAARLGLPVLTSESKVAVQPMFLPTQFSDSGEADHPLIAHSLDGKPFTLADIAGEHTFEDAARRTAPSDDDALAFLRAPVDEVTLAIAADALASVDPDCGRHEWLAVAAALKHQFNHNAPEEAYQAFDTWSATGSKYQGTEDSRAMWDSVRPSPLGRAPVTIRTVLKMAVAGGWDDGKIREKCFQKTVQWIETVETVTELIEKGVKRILSVPLLSAVQEDVLVNHLVRQAKSQFAHTISARAIRKDMDRAKAAVKAAENPPEKQRDPLWARGVCYIAAMNEFYRHRTGEKYAPSSFDRIYARHLLPDEKALKEAGKPITPDMLAKPIVPPSDYALNHLKLTTVYDYAYDPAQPSEVFFVNRGRKYINTYSPTYPEADAAGAEAAGALFLSHINNLIVEEEYRRALVDFMAYMVQCPGRKIRWAPLIQGVEGAGKTFLAGAMKAVLGKEHVRTISGEAIKKGWNEWSFGSQLIVLEEVRLAGANKHETMNTLKPLITNDDISIQQRNRDSREAENNANYMLFSNHHDALALTPGDRRFFVVKSRLQTKQQVLALGEDYFAKLFNMLRDSAGALRSFFLGWEISADFAPDRHAPRTSYVQEMVQDSANEVTAAVRLLLTEGPHPLIQYDVVSVKAILDYLALEEGMARVSAQHLGHVLRDEGFTQAGRHYVGEERHRLWVRHGISESDAIARAEHRVRTKAVNLQMQEIY